MVLELLNMLYMYVSDLNCKVINYGYIYPSPLKTLLTCLLFDVPGKDLML